MKLYWNWLCWCNQTYRISVIVWKKSKRPGNHWSSTCSMHEPMWPRQRHRQIFATFSVFRYNMIVNSQKFACEDCECLHYSGRILDLSSLYQKPGAVPDCRDMLSTSFITMMAYSILNAFEKMKFALNFILA